MQVLVKNEICPHVENPFADCYCINLTSQYIKPAIQYCGNDYYSCEIYIRNAAAAHRSSDRNNSDQSY